MKAWKVTAIENQNRLRFICDSEHVAGGLMGILERGHTPKPWRGELYPIRFEVEVIETDAESEVDFEALEPFMVDEPFIDELDLEDVEVE